MTISNKRLEEQLAKNAEQKKRLLAQQAQKRSQENQKLRKKRTHLFVLIGANLVNTYRENPKVSAQEVLKKLSEKDRTDLWDLDNRLEKWGEETMNTIADAENGIGMSQSFNSLAEMKTSLNA